MNIFEAMLYRKSVRTFSDKPVPEELLAGLVDRFHANDRLNDLPLTLVPVPGRQVAHAMIGLIGNYGAIKGAPTWVIGISKDGENDQVNFGFALEQFILQCTQKDLGTCWVGGFFKKSQLQQAVPIEPGHRIVCITPVGYAAKRRFAERTMRTVGGLNQRKPLAERVFQDQWGRPAGLDADPKRKQMFEMARWAPSASNQQPSHFILDDNRIVLASVLPERYKKMTQRYAKNKAEGLNFQGVDAGISMAHIHLAAQELGIQGKWSLAIDPETEREKLRIPSEATVFGEFQFS
jgi:nitroreductase